ncbi:MAG: tyrosine-type recombinase/integrase [Thermodesulfobacteriota bacterium]
MSVHRRGDSWVVIYWEDGRHVKKYFGVRKYGKGAEQAAREWEAGRRAVMPTMQGVPTLRDLVLMYGQAQDLHRHTRLTIAYLLREPAADLAEKPADSLTRADLEILRINLARAGRGPNTIGKAQAYLSAALAWGLERGFIAIHPWAGYKKPKAEKRPFTATLDDFRRIIAVAPDYLRWALAVAWATGNRPGQVELFSLEWVAIDWRLGTITLAQGKSGRLKTVPLAASFLEEAARRFAHDRSHGFLYIIHRGDGQRVKSMRTCWHTAVKRAGLAGKGIRMYDLRHCVATHLLDEGVPLPVVAGRLGHSTPAVTASVYSHALDYRSREAAELLPDLTAEPTLPTYVPHVAHKRKTRG